MKFLPVFNMTKVFHVFPTLLMIFVSLLSYADDGYDEICLNEIDLKTILPLKNLMEDIISEKEDNASKYYTVYLKKHQDVKMAYVTEEIRHELKESEDYRGYFTIGNDTIIIRTSGSDNIQLSLKRRMTKFPTSKNVPITYDPNTWVYLFNNKYFARYIHGIGWIWFSPLDKSISDFKKGYRVTVPKRLSEND